MSILEYRNTPAQGLDSSPALRLMNRRTKTLLPTASYPRVIYPERETKLSRKRQTEQANYYNPCAGSLPELSDGDVVRMYLFRLGDKERRKATVTGRLDKRSNTVETPE